MNDTQFDDFFNDKLREHAAPVPAGLWEKVAEGQFDQFIGAKLRDNELPVPDGLWDKIADAQFDHFIGNKLAGQTAPLPAGLWDKINDGRFDQFIAGRLTNHESPVPAGLWEKVRPKEDDDRTAFIWFRYPAAAILLVGILLAGTIGTYFFFNTGESTLPETNTLTNTIKPVQPGASALSNNHQPVTPNPADIKADNKSNSSSVLETASEKKSLPNLPNVSPANAASKQNIAGPPDTDPGAAGNSSLLVNSTGKRFKPVIPANNNNLSQTPYDIFHNLSPVEKEELDTDLKNLDYYNHHLLTGFTIPGTSVSPESALGLLDKKLSTQNHTSQFRNIIICPADNKNRNTDWFLEAYASPDMPFKQVSNISATPLYLAKKDSSESMQVSYSAGLRLVKPITDNIILKAGAQYSQVNEKYVYRTENEVKTTTVVSVRTIIRAPGDTVIVRDTSTLQTIGFRNNTVYNRYRSIDIPVTVGYQFGNEDLKIGINAGVLVNLSSWYQGVVLDSSLATVPVNKNGSPQYKSNLGLGLYGGISVVKKLSDDLHLFFEPYFRYNLTNMTTQQASYNQKLSVGGLSLGLRFNLNRK